MDKYLINIYKYLIKNTVQLKKKQVMERNTQVCTLNKHKDDYSSKLKKKKKVYSGCLNMQF